VAMKGIPPDFDHDEFCKAVAVIVRFSKSGFVGDYNVFKNHADSIVGYKVVQKLHSRTIGRLLVFNKEKLYQEYRIKLHLFRHSGKSYMRLNFASEAGELKVVQDFARKFPQGRGRPRKLWGRTNMKEQRDSVRPYKPLVNAIVYMSEHDFERVWVGRVSELWDELNQMPGVREQMKEIYPANPQVLGKYLRKEAVKHELEFRGVELEFKKVTASRRRILYFYNRFRSVTDKLISQAVEDYANKLASEIWEEKRKPRKKVRKPPKHPEKSFDERFGLQAYVEPLPKSRANPVETEEDLPKRRVKPVETVEELPKRKVKPLVEEELPRRREDLPPLIPNFPVAGEEPPRKKKKEGASFDWMKFMQDQYADDQKFEVIIDPELANHPDKDRIMAELKEEKSKEV